MKKYLKILIVFIFAFSFCLVNLNAQTKVVKNQSRENLELLLQTAFDTSKLELLIEIVESEDLSTYTDLTYKNLKKALVSAKAIVKNPESQSEINQAEADLSIAFKYAEKSDVKKLQTLVLEVEALVNTIKYFDLDIFTKDSFNLLNGELIGAKVFLDQQATDEVGGLKLYNSLIKVLSNLTYTQDQKLDIADFDKKLVDLIKDLDQKKYYNFERASFNMLKIAENNAKRVLFNPASLDVVEKHKLYAAHEALVKTLRNLETITSSKEKLEVLIKEVESLDLSLYHDDGKAQLETSLKAALELVKKYQDYDFSQSDKGLEASLSKAEVDDLYELAVVDLGDNKANLKLIKPDLVLGDLEDEETFLPSEKDPNPPLAIKDFNQINRELFLYLAIVGGSLIMIGLIFYNQYQNKKSEKPNQD